MIFAAEILLTVLATLGHAALWVALANRIHAFGISRWVIALLSGFCWALMWFIGGLAVAAWLAGTPRLLPVERVLALMYFALCFGLGLVAVGVWLHRIVNRHERADVLLSDRVTSIDMVKRLGHPIVETAAGWLFTRLPGNEALRLHIHDKALSIPRLWPQHDGLRLAHLTDLHMSGRMCRDYYEELVELTNERQPDLVALTGDLFDESLCFDWIPTTLSRLRARFGVYFVLGNHELKVDAARVRKLLADAGLVDLGGQWKRITVHGHPLILAGNSLPWFAPAPDMESCPATPEERRVARILLSHSPDQIDWARRGDFDLVLAGHTHGGQIRFPVIGPIFSPSRMGTRYSAGTFYREPTVLHVSRGTSNHAPLRWNCPPELTFLDLQSSKLPAPDEPPAAQFAEAVA